MGVAFIQVLEPKAAGHYAGKDVLLQEEHLRICLLYTSDAADERSSVDLGGRRIIKKKKNGKEYARTDDKG